MYQKDQRIVMSKTGDEIQQGSHRFRITGIDDICAENQVIPVKYRNLSQRIEENVQHLQP